MAENPLKQQTEKNFLRKNILQAMNKFALIIIIIYFSKLYTTCSNYDIEVCGCQ